jgi:polar amino acid transport system substrate-binding protein
VQNNAIFMKPGDFTWWLALNTIVNELRWGSRYEEYAALFEKWFGAKPPPQRFYL